MFPLMLNQCLHCLEKYGITKAADFDYLMRGNTDRVQGIDDVQEYKDMRNAMTVIGLSANEQAAIFRMHRRV